MCGGSFFVECEVQTGGLRISLAISIMRVGHGAGGVANRRTCLARARFGKRGRIEIRKWDFFQEKRGLCNDYLA